jgi:hypothetical protein
LRIILDYPLHFLELKSSVDSQTRLKSHGKDREPCLLRILDPGLNQCSADPPPFVVRMNS